MADQAVKGAGTMAEDSAATQAAAQEGPRARVRRLLIEPLVEQGMSRKRSMSVAEHERCLDKLTDYLGYLSDANLAAIGDLVVRFAEGERKNIWPDVVTIRNWAWRLQDPPPRVSPYPASVMRSAMGRRAFDDGYAVELYRIARRLGPPPGKYVIAKLRDEARENRRRRDLIAERQARGAAAPDDLAWLERYQADEQEALAIVQDARREGVA